MMKDVQLFLSPRDEVAFGEGLRRARPSVGYLDGNNWEAGPVERESLGECLSGVVYLWDKGILPVLPTIRRNRRTIGPGAGVVIQYQRGRVGGDELTSGSMAVSFNDEDVLASDMRRFAKDAWAQLKVVCAGGIGLECYELSSGTTLKERVSAYWGGADAIQWLKGSADRRFKASNGQVYFRPIAAKGSKKTRRRR